RIEAGKLELSNAPLDIVNTVNETLQLFEPEAIRRGLTLGCKFTEDVPRCLLGDEGRIRQILINLVGNAIKFTDEGSVSVRVATQAVSAHKTNIIIEVADTGIGISDAARDKVFEAFCQENTEQVHSKGGTGLGLAITRQLVSMMAGSIEVKSNSDRGTVFILRLPMNVASEAENPAMAATAAHSTTLPGNTLTDKSILIAEDNLVNQFYAAEILKSMGCHVTTANDGELAVAACHSGRFDAILMDMQMPNLDGLEATRAIRHMEDGANRRTPIIAVTANAQAGERENCINAGLDDFISKPFSVSELQSVLARWLRHDMAHTDNNPLH
ncbi:MAG: ATP-binding protein, partial [Gammaproteobacteria bacterium]|nr:ATP-binding protein [Gammaproteobacteria bacterium]